MKKLCCLRCNSEMNFLKCEKLQLGQTGFFFGDWPNLLAGALEVEIYCCPHCGKVEFFTPGLPEPVHEEPEFELSDLPPEAEQKIVDVSMDGVPQIRCPLCGTTHDFDYPRCPRCNHSY